MDSSKDIGYRKHKQVYLSLCEQELRKRSASSAALENIQWYTLLTMAIKSLHDGELTQEEFVASKHVVANAIQEVFRQDLGCRWTLTDHLDMATKGHEQLRREHEAAKSSWIETYSGIQFYPLSPNVDRIVVVDIAHALSNLCRFGGHTGWFYSFAQHSVLVSQACPPSLALEGLLHDASEAYLLDLPSPIKRLAVSLPYRLAEHALSEAIAERFDLRFPFDEKVLVADLRVLATEVRDCMQFMPKGWDSRMERSYPPLKDKIVPLDAIDAEQLFLDEFDRLTETRSADLARQGGG
jgi:5'-deoxynucleotidase YfbR-like HD superfamily hydrolase